MIEKVLILAIGTAGIVYTMHNASAFGWWRNLIKKLSNFTLTARHTPRGRIVSFLLVILDWFLHGAMCSLCFAYWVAAVLLFLLPEVFSIFFAVVWLAVHSLEIYVSLTHLKGQNESKNLLLQYEISRIHNANKPNNPYKPPTPPLK